MTYQERDLAVVVIAALGAGFLVGASMQQQQPTPVTVTNGTTIVRRLELPPRPRPATERWDGDVLRVALTTTPLMIQTPPWQDARTQQDPEPEVTPAERAMLQQESEKPRDSCYPGHRENFYYKRVLHWRCRR